MPSIQTLWITVPAQNPSGWWADHIRFWSTFLANRIVRSSTLARTRSSTSLGFLLLYAWQYASYIVLFDRGPAFPSRCLPASTIFATISYHRERRNFINNDIIDVIPIFFNTQYLLPRNSGLSLITSPPHFILLFANGIITSSEVRLYLINSLRVHTYCQCLFLHRQTVYNISMPVTLLNWRSSTQCCIVRDLL